MTVDCGRSDPATGSRVSRPGPIRDESNPDIEQTVRGLAKLRAAEAVSSFKTNALPTVKTLVLSQCNQQRYKLLPPTKLRQQKPRIGRPRAAAGCSGSAAAAAVQPWPNWPAGQRTAAPRRRQRRPMLSKPWTPLPSSSRSRPMRTTIGGGTEPGRGPGRRRGGGGDGGKGGGEYMTGHGPGVGRDGGRAILTTRTQRAGLGCCKRGCCTACAADGGTPRGGRDCCAAGGSSCAASGAAARRMGLR